MEKYAYGWQCCLYLSRCVLRAVAACLIVSGVGLAVLGRAPAQAETTPQPSATFDPAAFKGKVVYVDFWASWCGPCRQSFPYMEQLRETYGPKGFVVVAINLDHDRRKADAFLQVMHSAIPIVFDPAGKLATKYRVDVMPTSVLIGRDGRVRYTHKGFFQAKIPEYNTHIQELMHE